VDKSAKMTYAMIEVAIDKGIRDIQDNTHRGIRNLIDLGSHLSQGRFHQDFFRITQQMLANENSPLYELTRKIVSHVDHQLLKNTAAKLGYTCLTYGAQQIRDHERRNGYNVPWTIVFDFRRVCDNRLSQAEVSEVLKQGEAIGIYCGMFFINNNQQNLADLLEGLAVHKEGTYFIFAEPEAINPDIAKKIVENQNVVLILHLATPGKQSYSKAAAVLFDNKCLFGTYSEYDDDNLAYLTSDSCLTSIKEANSVCFFMVRKNLQKPENHKLMSKFIKTAKTAARYPLIIFDFYTELAHVDRTISVEECFIAILGDGRLAVKNMDSVQPHINIRTQSFQSILERTMPRISY
jgi:hypothetical protein